MPLTQGRPSGSLSLDGLRIQLRNVLLGFSQYFRVEHMPGKLIRSHVLGLFLNLLSHGASMREQMDLCKLVEQYGDDTNCRKALENIRWPDGVRCPSCKSEKISRIVARNQFDCDSCRYQFSVLSGTIFHDTHLRLHKWFLATYLLCESKKGMSALQMQKAKLRTINHTRQYAHGDVHTNTVESAFSLLKRGIVGTWHKVDAKHLPAYLDEMCFRFNNRKNPYLFRDTIIKLINTQNLEYKDLTAKVQDAA